MKTRLFVVFVLAGAIATCALTAGEEPRPSTSDELDTVNQLLETKTEGLVVTLEVRCKKMIDMQSAVYDGTKGLDKIIEGNADKAPRTEDKQISVKLSEKQKAIVVEATTALDMLKEEAAVAFSEVFEELRADMKRVQSRLEMGDVGAVTQAIEKDIIDTLKEMIRPIG